jgi:pimeloyl-ACP methyl ester carboxylesterase
METARTHEGGAHQRHVPEAPRHLAGLAADEDGQPDERPPLVLLHGLTFDRSMWRPALAELRRIDPDRQTISLDLPGHGQSPGWPSYDVASLSDGVHRAVQAAHLRSPVIVGHSMSAVVATDYAARHPTAGVVNVDQSLEVAPFAGFVRTLAQKLRGPDFPEVWEVFARSMHVDLLSESARKLVQSTTTPRQDLVTAYWREILDRPIADVVDQATTGFARLRAAGTPYLVVAGDELEPGYMTWLMETLPQVTIAVWPGSGHFPHLAHPDLFAERLSATGQWPGPGERHNPDPPGVLS